ncbi:hypothetical protein [Nostoc sp.]|uniref:hypothetical protein n=1 Tax=Nostoc sp. TaxID=1180 RepID=UPI00359359E6
MNTSTGYQTLNFPKSAQANFVSRDFQLLGFLMLTLKSILDDRLVVSEEKSTVASSCLIAIPTVGCAYAT